jgi:hypothetical protein
MPNIERRETIQGQELDLIEDLARTTGTSNTLYKAKVPGPGYRVSRHAHLDHMAGVSPNSSNHATGFEPPDPQPLPHATLTAQWMRMPFVASMGAA